MRTDTGSGTSERERELLGNNVHTWSWGATRRVRPAAAALAFPSRSRAHTGSTNFPGQVREPERVGERASNGNVGTQGVGMCCVRVRLGKGGKIMPSLYALKTCVTIAVLFCVLDRRVICTFAQQESAR